MPVNLYILDNFMTGGFQIELLDQKQDLVGNCKKQFPKLLPHILVHEQIGQQLMKGKLFKYFIMVSIWPILGTTALLLLLLDDDLD